MPSDVAAHAISTQPAWNILGLDSKSAFFSFLLFLVWEYIDKNVRYREIFWEKMSLWNFWQFFVKADFVELNDHKLRYYPV